MSPSGNVAPLAIIFFIKSKRAGIYTKTRSRFRRTVRLASAAARQAVKKVTQARATTRAYHNYIYKTYLNMNQKWEKLPPITKI